MSRSATTQYLCGVGACCGDARITSWHVVRAGGGHKIGHMLGSHALSGVPSRLPLRKPLPRRDCACMAVNGTGSRKRLPESSSLSTPPRAPGKAHGRRQPSCAAINCWAATSAPVRRSRGNQYRRENHGVAHPGQKTRRRTHRG